MTQDAVDCGDGAPIGPLDSPTFRRSFPASTRRDLVKAMVALPAGLALAGAAQSPSSTRGNPMLPAGTIDVHAHYLPPVYREALRSAGLTLLDGGVPVPNWSPEAALTIMDNVGVGGALLSVSSPFIAPFAGGEAVTLCRAVNDYGAGLRDKHPSRFGAYAILPLPLVRESLLELTRALDVLKLDGVALPTNVLGTYVGDPGLEFLLDALDERDATVFVHPTSPCCFEAIGLKLPAPIIEFPFDTTRAIVSLLYSKALSRRSRIKFIFSHGGGTLPFLAPRIMGAGASPLVGDRALPAADALSWIRRWHYDLALVGTPELVGAMRGLVPASQIVYGTDYPFASGNLVGLAAAGFAALPFNDDERVAVARGNAAGLFPEFASRCGCH
jgi:6-methylsalicylate decarboxylase